MTIKALYGYNGCQIERRMHRHLRDTVTSNRRALRSLACMVNLLTEFTEGPSWSKPRDGQHPGIPEGTSESTIYIRAIQFSYLACQQDDLCSQS
jgi:hypothetical protein